MKRINNQAIFLGKSFFILTLISILIIYSIPIKSYQINQIFDFKEADIKNNGLSVILMIGDGMGFNQTKLAQLTEFGENSSLNLQSLPYEAEVITNSLDSLITDSAAAATAMATGIKTNNGMLSITLEDYPQQTILEYAKSLKKSNGLITTTEIVHATPAAFFSHVKSRYNYTEITRQLVEEVDVDILLGGGKQRFSSSQLLKMKERGYSILENLSQLQEANTNKLLGLFSSEALPYEQYRDRETIPSLSEMSKKAIELLSQDSDGFFLMIEGGQIDWGGHNNNAVNTALETIEFDKAVKVAKNYVENHSNTILIVTADHETGGLQIISNTLNSTIPNLMKTEEENEQLRIARINNISVNWSTTSHTKVNVPFYGLGDGCSIQNNSIINNTDIFSIIKLHLDSDIWKPSIEIYNPLNTTYDKLNVWLNFSINETPSWFAYSLNSSQNNSIKDYNILLTLPEGYYHLALFANDSLGNTGKSDVWFTIKIFTPLSSTESTRSPTPGLLYLDFLVIGIFLVYIKKKISSK